MNNLDIPNKLELIDGDANTNISDHTDNKSTNNEIDNPYFNNQNGFNDKLDSERANTASWRFIAWFSNFITLIAVIGAIYLASLPRTVPFIFKEDGSGGLTALGLATKPLHFDNQVIANQIALFIIALREVPLAVGIKKRYVTRVEMMSTPALFHNVLTKNLKDSYLHAGASEVIITIKSIVPLPHNTWEVSWIESGQSGTSMGEYKATLSIELSKEFTNSSTQVYNPIGLVITDININKVIGS